MIEQVINKISEQQKGLEEYSAVYQVGEQLKDICRTTSGAAAEAEQLRSEMKKRELATNKSVIEFETLFRNAQETMNKLIDIINSSDVDIAVKLRKALKAFFDRYTEYTE